MAFLALPNTLVPVGCVMVECRAGPSVLSHLVLVADMAVGQGTGEQLVQNYSCRANC